MRTWIFTLLAITVAAQTHAATSITLDLSKQRAYLLKEGKVVETAPISSGRSSHPTPAGTFRVQEKDIDHQSNLYGKIVSSSGKVLKADADSGDRVPPGARFKPAPMRYFLRFRGPVGMHAGHLPGYPASHSCVRLPASKAKAFYQAVQVGTPVRVVGSASRR